MFSTREQEKDLERKFTMLNQELRAAQSVEDWRKTEVQREKERLLLEELVTIVDKRDQLVQHLHNQEIAYVIMINIDITIQTNSFVSTIALRMITK